MRPEASPRADNENATGNPINMMKMSPANIKGAKFSILIAKVFRSEYPSDKDYLTMQPV